MRWAAAEALKELVVEDDLSWLAEWVASYPLAQVGEMVNRVLIHLDRKLYFPGGELCNV